jgi:hypothetical protein
LWANIGASAGPCGKAARVLPALPVTPDAKPWRMVQSDT